MSTALTPRDALIDTAALGRIARLAHEAVERALGKLVQSLRDDQPTERQTLQALEAARRTLVDVHRIDPPASRPTPSPAPPPAEPQSPTRPTAHPERTSTPTPDSLDAPASLTLAAVETDAPVAADPALAGPSFHWPIPLNASPARDLIARAGAAPPVCCFAQPPPAVFRHAASLTDHADALRSVCRR